MVDALKPCPFCGSDAFVLSRENGHWAYCNNDECGAETQGKTTHSDAAAAWNRRSTLSDAVAEREAEPPELRQWRDEQLDRVRDGSFLTSPPTSELEALRKRVAELEKPSRERFYYPIVMPVDADGQGPADLKDAAKLTWEVWDQELMSHGSFDFLADAIDLANELNARRVREGGKVDGRPS